MKINELVEKEKNEIINFCKELIKCKSETGKEYEVARLIERKMNELNYDLVEIDDVGNVIGIIYGQSNKIQIVFDGHMDTVATGILENWKTNPYGAEIINNRIYGRGASDMKGALASMIFAGGFLKRTNKRLNNGLAVACVVNEENHEGLGIKHVLQKKKIMPRCVIVGEATNLQLSIGQRGRAEIEVLTIGKIAHGSTPWLGMNAIYEIVPIIEEVSKMNKILPKHPLLGKSSITVSHIISKPLKGNIVPDLCKIILDRRIIPNENERTLIKEIKEIIEKVREKSSKIKAKVRIIETEVKTYTGYKERVKKYFPSWLMDKDNYIVKMAQQALRKTFKKSPRLICWKFSTDGSYTAGVLGIPTIGFGPGSEKTAHSYNENIPIDHLIKATEGYINLGIELC
jgi:putative selenium metabolism hydrolase